MGISDITVSGLAAVPTVKGNALTWSVADTWPKGSPYSLDGVEVWAATSNDRALAGQVAEGIATVVHGTATDAVLRYYWIRPRNRLGSYGAWHPASATAGVPCTSLSPSSLHTPIVGAKVIASVAGNALTLALKTAGGNDPSPGEPIYASFRSASNDGLSVARTVTAPLSLTISAGSTLGVPTNNTTFKLWVALVDYAGTLRLAVVNPFDRATLAVSEFPEHLLIEALAEGGVGGADSPGVFYASVWSGGLRAFRFIGYFECMSGFLVAGNWDSAPNVFYSVSSGALRPGQVVRTTEILQTDYVSGTGTIPYDDTKPQFNEGNRLLLTNVVLSSIQHVVRYEGLLQCSHSAPGPIIGALLKQNEADATITGLANIAAADAHAQLVLRGSFLSTSLDTTVEVRAGAAAAGTFSLNGGAGSRKLGGTLTSVHRFLEIAT